MKHRYALHQNNQQQQPITAKKHAVNELLATPNIFRANKRARILAVVPLCCMHKMHGSYFSYSSFFPVCLLSHLSLTLTPVTLNHIAAGNCALLKSSTHQISRHLRCCLPKCRCSLPIFSYFCILFFFFIIICSSAAAVVDGNGTKTKDRAFGGALFAWNG